MSDAIENLKQKLPTAQFGMLIEGGPDSLFAYRWPRDMFSSFKEFCAFCDRNAHLFPLIVEEFDPRTLEVFLIEENLLLTSSPNTIQADIRALLDERFDRDVIPWLKLGQYDLVDDASDNEEMFLRAVGKLGFFAAIIEEDINDNLVEGTVSAVQKLPIKAHGQSSTLELPFDAPEFSERIINNQGVGGNVGDSDFQVALNKIHNRVANRIGEPTLVQFAAYELDEHGNPIDNLDEVAILDYAVVIAEAQPDQFADSVAFESEWMDEPTWIDLCVVLHNQMKHTRDFVHVFLEGVGKLRGASMHKPQASLFELILGS